MSNDNVIGNQQTILANQAIVGADGNPIPGIVVNVYVGPTGSTSGQFGRFSSIVAQAIDTNKKSGFIRRLEITQESFAKFAYWSNSEKNGSMTIYFNNHDVLWGPVWSNDTISIGTGGATFHDEVGTTAPAVNGSQYGTFSKGLKVAQKPIALPSLTMLSNLATIATSSGWNFTSASASRVKHWQHWPPNTAWFTARKPSRMKSSKETHASIRVSCRDSSMPMAACKVLNAKASACASRRATSCYFSVSSGC